MGINKKEFNQYIKDHRYDFQLGLLLYSTVLYNDPKLLKAPENKNLLKHFSHEHIQKIYNKMLLDKKKFEKDQNIINKILMRHKSNNK